MKQGNPSDTNSETQSSQVPSMHLADTPLAISQVGITFSTFSRAEKDFHTLLHDALDRGINLIDTTGFTEKLSLPTARDGVVLMEKMGYLRGEVYEWAEARKMDGRPFPNIVKFSQETDHCIHPDFLAAFLTRRLKRLNLAALDGLLLHNPEVYLQWATRIDMPLREAQRTFYQRIESAFIHLEQEVTTGRIQFYGISSNALTIHRHNPAFISLSAILERGDYPHFKLIELPFNLRETDAVTQINQPNGLDNVLDTAEKAGMAVVVKRPLSSQHEDKRIRLIDMPPPDYPATQQDVSTAVDSLIALESEFRSDVLPALALDTDDQVSLQNKLRIGHMLQGKWGGLGGYWNWIDLRSFFILPEAQSAVQTLQNIEKPPFTLPGWLDAYVEAVNELLAALTAFYQEQTHDEAQALYKQAIAVDSDWDAASLPGTTVRALLSTSPITSIMLDTSQMADWAAIQSAWQHPIEQKPRREAWQMLVNSKQ